MEPKFYSIAIDGPAGRREEHPGESIGGPRWAFCMWTPARSIAPSACSWPARGGDCGDKAQVLIRLLDDPDRHDAMGRTACSTCCSMART